MKTQITISAVIYLSVFPVSEAKKPSLCGSSLHVLKRSLSSRGQFFDFFLDTDHESLDVSNEAHPRASPVEAPNEGATRNLLVNFGKGYDNPPVGVGDEQFDHSFKVHPAPEAEASDGLTTTTHLRSSVDLADQSIDHTLGMEGSESSQNPHKRVLSLPLARDEPSKRQAMDISVGSDSSAPVSSTVMMQGVNQPNPTALETGKAVHLAASEEDLSLHGVLTQSSTMGNSISGTSSNALYLAHPLEQIESAQLENDPRGSGLSSIDIDQLVGKDSSEATILPTSQKIENSLWACLTPRYPRPPSDTSGFAHSTVQLSRVKRPDEFSPTLSQIAILLSLEFWKDNYMLSKRIQTNAKQILSCLMYSLLLKELSSSQIAAVAEVFLGFLKKLDKHYLASRVSGAPSIRKDWTLSDSLTWIAEMLNNLCDGAFFSKFANESPKPNTGSPGRPKGSLATSECSKCIRFLAFEHNALDRTVRAYKATVIDWLCEAWYHDLEHGFLDTLGGGISEVVDSRRLEFWQLTSFSIYYSAARIPPLISKSHRPGAKQFKVWLRYLDFLRQKQIPADQELSRELQRAYVHWLPQSSDQMRFYRHYLPNAEPIVAVPQGEDRHTLRKLHLFYSPLFNMFSGNGFIVDMANKFYAQDSTEKQLELWNQQLYYLNRQARESGRQMKIGLSRNLLVSAKSPLSGPI